MVRARPVLTALVAAGVLAGAAGCAYKQDHVYVVREGSRGATGVQGGGCGCN